MYVEWKTRVSLIANFPKAISYIFITEFPFLNFHIVFSKVNISTKAPKSGFAQHSNILAKTYVILVVLNFIKMYLTVLTDYTYSLKNDLLNKDNFRKYTFKGI